MLVGCTIRFEDCGMIGFLCCCWPLRPLDVVKCYFVYDVWHALHIFEWHALSCVHAIQLDCHQFPFVYISCCVVSPRGRNRNGERSQQSQPYRTSRGNWQFHPDILSSSTTSTRRFSPQLGKQINSPIHEANFFPVYGFVWNCSFAHRIIFIDMWYLSVNWEGVSGRRPTMCLHVTLKSICMASPIHGIAEDADVYASRAIIEPNSLRCLYIYPSNYPKYTCRPRQTCVSWRSMDFRRIVSLPLPFRGRQLCPQNAGIQRRCGTNIVPHVYEWILIWYGSARATYTNEIINRGTIK